MTRLARLAVTALAAATVATTAAGDDRVDYLAFGDSVTHGSFDSTGQGYPPRLQTQLRSGGRDAFVTKSGRPGEQTSSGLSRITSVLDAGDYDTVLLMEGTNDIFFSVSVETTIFNLDQIARKAAGKGVGTMHLSVIPIKMQGTNDPDPVMNPQATTLGSRVSSLASSNDRWMVHINSLWSGRFPLSTLFESYYYQGGEDPVGHPVSIGYEMLATDVADFILARAIPGKPTLTSPVGDIPASNPTYKWRHDSSATWYRLEVDGPTAIDEWIKADTVCGSTNCSYRPTTLLGFGDYSWQVTPRNPSGCGATSDELAFRFWDGPPEIAVTVSPNRTFASSPEFVWRRVPNAESYVLEVDDTTDTLLSEGYDASDICGTGTCVVQPALALDPGDYAFRVKSINPIDESDWSADHPFEVVLCDPIEELTIGPGTLDVAAFYESCGSITVTEFTVLDGGDLSIHAANTVVVEPGTKIERGGFMSIDYDPLGD